MRALRALVFANLRSFLRDRLALFWTLAFPILFVILFGSIFSSSGPSTFDTGWVDEDGTPAAAGLRQGFASTGLLDLRDESREAALDAMRDGDLTAVIVVPQATGSAMATPGAAPIALEVYTDPSQQTTSTTVMQVVSQVVGAANLVAAGASPVLSVEPRSVQSQQL